MFCLHFVICFLFKKLLLKFDCFTEIFIRSISDRNKNSSKIAYYEWVPSKADLFDQSQKITLKRQHSSDLKKMLPYSVAKANLDSRQSVDPRAPSLVCSRLKIQNCEFYLLMFVYQIITTFRNFTEKWIYVDRIHNKSVMHKSNNYSKKSNKLRQTCAFFIQSEFLSNSIYILCTVKWTYITLQAITSSDEKKI